MLALRQTRRHPERAATAVSEALSSGADPDEIIGAKCVPVIHVASGAGMHDVVEALLKGGATARSTAADNSTVLHAIAAALSHVGSPEDADSLVRCTQLVVEAGAPVGARDSRGVTPLSVVAADLRKCYRESVERGERPEGSRSPKSRRATQSMDAQHTDVNAGASSSSLSSVFAPLRAARAARREAGEYLVKALAVRPVAEKRLTNHGCALDRVLKRSRRRGPRHRDREAQRSGASGWRAQVDVAAAAPWVESEARKHLAACNGNLVSGDDVSAALFEAAGCGDARAVVTQLNAGVPLQCVRVDDGWTPLHTAAACAVSSDATRELAHRGGQARVNAADWAGLTPLHIAAFAGNQDTVNLLLGAGASAAAETVDGHTPADYAYAAGHTRIGATLAACATRGGSRASMVATHPRMIGRTSTTAPEARGASNRGGVAEKPRTAAAVKTRVGGSQSAASTSNAISRDAVVSYSFPRRRSSRSTTAASRDSTGAASLRRGLTQRLVQTPIPVSSDGSHGKPESATPQSSSAAEDAKFADVPGMRASSVRLAAADEHAALSAAPLKPWGGAGRQDRSTKPAVAAVRLRPPPATGAFVDETGRVVGTSGDRRARTTPVPRTDSWKDGDSRFVTSEHDVHQTQRITGVTAAGLSPVRGWLEGNSVSPSRVPSRAARIKRARLQQVDNHGRDRSRGVLHMGTVTAAMPPLAAGSRPQPLSTEKNLSENSRPEASERRGRAHAKATAADRLVGRDGRSAAELEWLRDGAYSNTKNPGLSFDASHPMSGDDAPSERKPFSTSVGRRTTATATCSKRLRAAPGRTTNEGAGMVNKAGRRSPELRPTPASPWPPPPATTANAESTGELTEHPSFSPMKLVRTATDIDLFSEHGVRADEPSPALAVASGRGSQLSQFPTDAELQHSSPPTGLMSAQQQLQQLEGQLPMLFAPVAALGATADAVFGSTADSRSRPLERHSVSHGEASRSATSSVVGTTGLRDRLNSTAETAIKVDREDAPPAMRFGVTQAPRVAVQRRGGGYSSAIGIGARKTYFEKASAMKASQGELQALSVAVDVQETERIEAWESTGALPMAPGADPFILTYAGFEVAPPRVSGAESLAQALEPLRAKRRRERLVRQEATTRRESGPAAGVVHMSGNRSATRASSGVSADEGADDASWPQTTTRRADAGGISDVSVPVGEPLRGSTPVSPTARGRSDSRRSRKSSRRSLRRLKSRGSRGSPRSRSRKSHSSPRPQDTRRRPAVSADASRTVQPTPPRATAVSGQPPVVPPTSQNLLRATSASASVVSSRPESPDGILIGSLGALQGYGIVTQPIFEY